MSRQLLTWFARGGGVMVALGVLAFVLAFLLVERFWATAGRIRALRSSGEWRGRHAFEALELVGWRRMGLIRACVAIAPLLGLLGTVTGMMSTFQSILHGGYITEMSQGIGQALLTTQYGLAIAVPGLLAERLLLRRMEALARLARENGHDGQEGD